jgi:hypothetical protein
MAQIRTAQLDAADDMQERAQGHIEAARELHVGGVEHARKLELLDEQHKAKMKQAKEPKHGD